MPRSAALAAVIVLGLGGSAAAQPWFPRFAPPPQPWTPSIRVAERPKADTFGFFGAHLGLGTPIGFAGFEGGLAIDWFRASASVGLGMRGMLVAGMARAVHDFSGLDIGIGVGISRGPGTHTLAVGWRDSEEPDWEVQYASGTIWNDVEISIEVPLESNAYVRLYAGGTHAILAKCEIEHYVTEEIMGCSEADRQELVRDSFQPYLGATAGFKLF